jgi:HlyD family secretion protein
MRDAIATVEKAKVQVELTNKQFIRTDTLFHQKVASQADYDLAYSNYKAAQAELMAATASLEHEQTNLHYATIKAPITGTVISRNVDVGQTVISSFNAPTLFTIANDLTQMQVLADVDEADIGQIKVGQQTSFTVDAYPYDKFTGTVAQIRLQPVVVQNVNNYVVVINVANPDLKLLPGLTANINIKVEERQDVLKVPINAIHFTPSTEYLQTMQLTDTLIRQIKSGKVAGNEIPRSGSTCYVWLKDGQNIKPEKITTGIFDGTYIEINGKIREGQELVTGTTSAQAAAGTSNNPFLPKMPPRRTLR